MKHKTSQTFFLLCFSGAACKLSDVDGGHVLFPSGTERTGLESHQLDPPQARKPSSETQPVKTGEGGRKKVDE